MFPVPSSSSSTPSSDVSEAVAAKKEVFARVNRAVANATQHFTVPPTPTTAITQQLPTAAQPSVPSSTMTHPFQPLSSMLASPIQNAAALASNPLFVSALENATTAALISKLATALSHVTDSMVQSLANKDSTESVASALKEAVQLLAAMTALTVNLNNSVSKCMVALELGPPMKTDSVMSTPLPVASAPGGLLRSLLSKSTPRGDVEKENVPEGGGPQKKVKLSGGARVLLPRTASRRTRGDSFPTGQNNLRRKA
ncbi:unnamed protein product [Mesocestoides corti]|uniref:Uncharacterized protein n=1 Tax=Mesocestoides corti TaxID=53468 RepID=A0A0R3UJM9_MESCO|nr:unnamed protein product [Mesocestoides corti]